MHPDIKRLAKDASLYGGSDVVAKALGLLLFPFFTKVLDPRDYGILDLLGVVSATIVPLAVAGLDSAFGYHFFSTKDEDERRGYFMSTVAIHLLFSLGILVAVLPFQDRLCVSLFGHTHLRALLAISLAIIPFAILNQDLTSLIRVLQQPLRFGITNTIRVILTASFSIYFVLIRRQGVVGAIVGALIVEFIMFIINLFQLRAYLSTRIEIGSMTKLLAYGFPLVPAVMLGWATTSVDRLVLTHFASVAEIGHYAVGAKIASLQSFVTLAFQLAFGAFAYTIRDNADAPSVYGRILRYFLLVSVPLAMGLHIFADPALRIVTRPEFAPAAETVRLQCLIPILTGCQNILGLGIFFSGRTWCYTRALAAAAGVDILGYAILVPPFGVMGAALATVLGAGTAAVLLHRYGRESYRIDVEWRRIAPLVAFYALVCLVPPTLFASLAHSLLVRTLIFLSAMFGIVMAGSVSRDEISRVMLAIRVKLLRERPTPAS